MSTSEPPRFDHLELERLLITFETAVKVRKRHQFYLWAQGSLQSFLPHETLLYGLGGPLSHDLRTEVCSRAVLSEEDVRRFNHGPDSLLQKAAQRWVRQGHQPLLLEVDTAGSLTHDMQALGVSRFACHGMPDLRSSHRHQPARGSFFVFLNVPTRNIGRYRYMLDLLLPHLHMAATHVCDNEHQGSGMPTTRTPSLSEREQQVLDWVRKGKTNLEIGQILSISPLTVKNHVQKILRKLNVSNRAQAAANSFKIAPQGAGKGTDEHPFAN
ncbi:XrtB/PEP-CTERM-associated transcriptional regulator EpsA [Viridibacterium curvum]|uniref:HTH luxR-type domain-containing protein n=1 Tax=Viridibacterium curvum TaxID=1101404 RepID=A0ABP9QL05_9RHOO